MSANSSIEWTDKTWNPVRGCSVISPGCVNCYAMKTAHRFSGQGRAYEGLTKLTERSGPQWTGVIRTVEDALLEPLSWRKPQRIFVNSMSDLFHEDVPFEFIDKVFAVMALAPQHTFQILTKRADRMRAYLSAHDVGLRWLVNLDVAPERHRDEWAYQEADAVRWTREGLDNVWLGVSVEDQPRADARIPDLLATPAAVRFISAEPLLGPVDLKPYVANKRTHHLCVDVEGALANRSFDGLTENGRPLSRGEAEAGLRALVATGVKRVKSTDDCVGFSDQTGCPGHPHARLDWVIVGGESGAGARLFDIQWARDMLAQRKAAGVACFMKQVGSRPDGWWTNELGPRFNRHALKDKKGGDPSEWPEDLRVREFPKAKVLR